MAGTVMVRRLNEPDWEAFRALRLEALETETHAFGADIAAHRERPPEYWASRARGSSADFVVGALVDERLVGIAGFVRESAPKTRHKGFIWGVYVSPPARRMGLGRQLLNRVLQEARGMEGLEQVALSVVSTNQWAVTLYRSLGFTTYGTEPHALRVGAEYLDEDLMVLML